MFIEDFESIAMCRLNSLKTSIVAGSFSEEIKQAESGQAKDCIAHLRAYLDKTEAEIEQQGERL